MSILKETFGRLTDGRESTLYTIENGNGIRVSVSDYGACLVRFIVPDRLGAPTDIVLGYDCAADYEKNDFYFGATVGRNANRIGAAAFDLDGVHYDLPKNDGVNNLHTDTEAGFHRMLWQAEADEAGNAVTFSRRSPDMEGGFPGNLDLSVTYTLTDENALMIRYEGISDRKTILNPTNHSYFNPDGHDSGPVTDAVLTLYAASFTETDSASIPTGRVLPVEGTPMDFRTPERIGARIDAAYEPLRQAGGYDHNWVLGAAGERKKAAVLCAASSGISMGVYTDLPGIQFYSGNYITPHAGKGGAHYGRRSGLGLETQYYPDSIHHPDFPQAVIEAGHRWVSVTEYRILWE